MKKYLEIAKAYMKAQLIWRSDTFVDVILAVSKILFAWILWSILFEGKEHMGHLVGLEGRIRGDGKKLLAMAGY